jgi:hypothetical protein
MRNAHTLPVTDLVHSVDFVVEELKVQELEKSINETSSYQSQD